MAKPYDIRHIIRALTDKDYHVDITDWSESLFSDGLEKSEGIRQLHKVRGAYILVDPGLASRTRYLSSLPEGAIGFDETGDFSFADYDPSMGKQTYEVHMPENDNWKIIVSADRYLAEWRFVWGPGKEVAYLVKKPGGLLNMVGESDDRILPPSAKRQDITENDLEGLSRMLGMAEEYSAMRQFIHDHSEFIPEYLFF